MKSSKLWKTLHDLQANNDLQSLERDFKNYYNTQGVEINMVKITYKAEVCKGCHYCVSACPKKCVTPSGDLNAKGYETVKFNEADCIACGSCYTMCPDYAITIVKED